MGISSVLRMVMALLGKAMRNRKCTVAVLMVLLFLMSVIVADSQSLDKVPEGRISGNSGPASSSSFLTGSGLFGSPYSIGLADAGVSQNGSYEYSSSSFLGSAFVNDLNVSGSLGKNMSIQLNLNLKFQYAGNTYVYWTQDVAILNTSDYNINFEDNVWNFSSSSSEMHNSSISGNGAVYSSVDGNVYIASASNSLPGSNISLKGPFSLSLMMNSSLDSNGTPQVTFMYNDEYGWVTYDRVTFIFASGSAVSDSNFVVDGQQNNPEGLYYDAEFILGGPGGGSSTRDNKSNLTMTLEFWNGHNFQEITNAINYGLDTGETITNALSTAHYYIQNGTIFESVQNGSESEGIVYYSSNISILKVSSPFDTGELSINGTNHTFVGGQVNLTLGPGNYTVKLYNGGLQRYILKVHLKAGGIYHYYEGEFPVNFSEKGLFKGTNWWVNIDGMNISSAGENLITHLPNGTYRYSVGPDNSVVKSSAGIVNVSGRENNTTVIFSYVLFNVTFHENGVRDSNTWGLEINNSTQKVSTESNITFQLINGTYTYNIINGTDYYLQNGSGTFIVNGANDSSHNVTLIPFSQIMGSFTPGNSEFFINGKEIRETGGNYSIRLKSGSYSLLVSSPGYHDFYYNFSVSDGQTILKNITLTKIIYPLNLSPYIGSSLGVVLFVAVYEIIRKRSKK